MVELAIDLIVRDYGYSHTDKPSDKAIDGVIVHGLIRKIYNSMEFLGNLAHAHAVGTRLSFPPPH